jgi:hypothetical protein
MDELDVKPDGVCVHANCACAAYPALDDYCSAYCANADSSDPEEAACGCGHDACLAAGHEASDDDEDAPTSIGGAPEAGDLDAADD